MAARPFWIGVSALAGGALAAAVLDAGRERVEWWRLGGIVLGVAVLGILTAMLATALYRPAATAAPTRPAPPDQRPERPGWPYAPQVPPAQPAMAVPSSPAPASSGRPPATSPQPWYEASRSAPAAGPGEEPPQSLAVPVPGGAWWQAPASDGKPASGRQRVPDDATGGPVDLSRYGVATRVVQCPRCGQFGVDVRQQQPGFAFDCRHCGHQWRWQPGTAWPVSVVRPRRAGRHPAERG